MPSLRTVTRPTSIAMGVDDGLRLVGGAVEHLAEHVEPGPARDLRQLSDMIGDEFGRFPLGHARIPAPSAGWWHVVAVRVECNLDWEGLSFAMSPAFFCFFATARCAASRRP